MKLIIKTESKDEKYFEENCFITEVLNSENHPDVSVSQARVSPAVTTELHRLMGVEEKYYILSGEGEMEIEGEIIGVVCRGDMVIIPKGHSQRIKNVGHDDLVFLCICTPRFQVGNYQKVEII